MERGSKYHQERAIICSPAKCLFKWWADNGPTLNAGFVIFPGHAKEPYSFVILRGSGRPVPLPLDPRMVNKRIQGPATHSFYLSQTNNAETSFNPYKPCILFVGHRQTMQNHIRRRKFRRLIRFSTVCKQKFPLKLTILKLENGLVLLIEVGKSVRLKWVKHPC